MSDERSELLDLESGGAYSDLPTTHDLLTVETGDYRVPRSVLRASWDKWNIYPHGNYPLQQAFTYLPRDHDQARYIVVLGEFGEMVAVHVQRFNSRVE